MISAKTYIVSSTSDALTQVLRDLVNLNPAPAPKGTYNEILGAQIVLNDPRQVFPYSSARKFNYAYSLMESIWNLTNTRETEVLRRYASIVDQFVADQGGDTSYAKWAYGTQLNEQVKFCLAELKADKMSRRAAAALYTSQDRGPGTPPCLVSVNWQCRPNAAGQPELYQFVNMRSNDAWLGLPLDFMQFLSWGHLMAAELQVPFVQYVHQASTLHLYDRDLAKARLWLSGRSHGDVMIHPARDFGTEAMSQVLSGKVYNSILYREAPRYSYVHGAEPLVHFMLGNIERAPLGLQALQVGGHGIGWPVRGNA
jgi:thymidylate synthase